MKESRITKRYAKALFDLAVEHMVQDHVFEDMKLVLGVCKTNREFRLVLASPIIKPDKKQNIIKSIYGEKINKMSLAYLLIIIRKRRESYIEGIAEQYIHLYKDYKGIKTVILKTPVPADTAIKNKAISLVKNYTKCEVELIEELREELIGGFIITLDSKQYDASILSNIEKLKREFNVNVYEKGF